MADLRISDYTVSLERLHRWARRSDVPGADTLVTDLAELRQAAKAFVDAVDALSAGDAMTPAEQAKCLTAIQIGLYDELAQHLDQLREPLARVTDRAYEGVPDTE